MSPSSRLGFRSEATRCTRCRERWPQFQGLCRTCSQELGVDLRGNREREADWLAKKEQALAKLRITPPPRTGRRSVQVEGEDFLVVWDGSTRLPILEALSQDLPQEFQGLAE